MTKGLKSQALRGMLEELGMLFHEKKWLKGYMVMVQTCSFLFQRIKLELMYEIDKETDLGRHKRLTQLL